MRDLWTMMDLQRVSMRFARATKSPSHHRASRTSAKSMQRQRLKTLHLQLDRTSWDGLVETCWNGWVMIQSWWGHGLQTRNHNGFVGQLCSQRSQISAHNSKVPKVPQAVANLEDKLWRCRALAGSSDPMVKSLPVSCKPCASLCIPVLSVLSVQPWNITSVTCGMPRTSGLKPASCRQIPADPRSLQISLSQRPVPSANSWPARRAWGFGHVWSCLVGCGSQHPCRVTLTYWDSD